MKKMIAVLGALSVFAAVPAFAHDMDGASMMIKKMDTNGDGMVSSDEHAAYADKMFKEADTNGDGQLSKDEIIAAHAKKKEAMASKTHHGIGHRGSAADTNDVKNSDANPHPTKDKQDQDM